MNVSQPSTAAKRTEPGFIEDFSRVCDRALYQPLADGWWIGATDIVGSTSAIGEGRYKQVNMAGASAISAVMNATGEADLLFAFGGDGASFAVPPEHEAASRDALARTARWSQERLGLTLRAALIPISDIRRAGHEVLVARYAPSSAVSYAMFAGGGMEWADTELKADDYAVAPAPAGSEPNLSGLSCRWKPIESRSGVILSVIVRRTPGADDQRFSEAINRVLTIADTSEHQGHPVPAHGPDFGSPLMGFDLEARAQAHSGAAPWQKLKLLAWRIFAWAVVLSGLRVGGFEAAHYRRQTALNSDFRKYQDGLNMTLDCTEHQAARIEAALGASQAEGIVRFGTTRQSQALMTCIVPSYAADDHFHFIDGAGGGYAQAASNLKQLQAGTEAKP